MKAHEVRLAIAATTAAAPQRGNHDPAHHQPQNTKIPEHRMNDVPGFGLGWLTGLEPATPATTTRCSTS